MNMRQIYRKLAKQHGVTPGEIRREMDKAIQHAYENQNVDSITKCYQSQIPKKGEVPTAEELITFAAKKIKSNQQK